MYHLKEFYIPLKRGLNLIFQIYSTSLCLKILRKNSLNIKNAYGLVWHMESKKIVHYVIHLPIKKEKILRYTLSLQLVIICNT